MIQADAEVRLQGLPAPKASGRVVRWCLAGALCLLTVGCVAAPTAQAEATQGQFRLVFELPRSDWHTSDSITGEATLSYLGSGSIGIGASGGGPIGFTFQEVGGSRHMGWVWTQSLVVFQLSASKPISSPISKSVAWTADDPNADFYSSFAHDPLVHLPAGDWTITAITGFEESTGPGSYQFNLQAAVQVHVTA